MTARGDRFEHARQIVGDGPDRRPAVCTVTRVTRYAIYYRNETGFLSHMPPDRFPTVVGRALPEEPE